MSRKPGPNYLVILFFILLGTILLFFIIKQNPYSDMISTVREQPIVSIALFIGISVVMLLLQTWRWLLIIKSTGRNVSFGKAFSYKIIGYGISFLTPTPKIGGEPVRAALLEREGLTYRKSLSTIIIDKVIDLSVMGVLFVFGVLVAMLSFALPQRFILLLVLVSLVILGVIGLFYYKMLQKNNFLLKLFRRLRLNKFKLIKGMEENIITFDRMLIKFYENHKKVFYQALVISIVTWVLMFFEYHMILLFFGYSLDPAQLFLIITTMGIAYMLPIPLALGVLEAGQIYVFRLLKLNSAAGVGLALIIRFRDLIWTIIAVILLTFHGLKLRNVYKTSFDRREYDDVAKELGSE